MATTTQFATPAILGTLAAPGTLPILTTLGACFGCFLFFAYYGHCFDFTSVATYSTLATLLNLATLIIVAKFAGCPGYLGGV